MLETSVKLGFKFCCSYNTYGHLFPTRFVKSTIGGQCHRPFRSTMSDHAILHRPNAVDSSSKCCPFENVQQHTINKIVKNQNEKLN